MQGTVQRNLLHRLGDAWTAFKAVPTPAQLYPPRQGVSTSYLTFPGWDRVEADAGGQDEARVKRAVQSTSVFANMRAIATEFSSSELIVKERKGTKLEDVENHPLEVLWESPNPYMGRSFLMSFWAWSYTMVGKSYLYWLPVGGQIKEVWPIPPFMIKPIPDAKNFIGGYAFRARPDAEVIKIPREYITYSHSPNLFDIRDGLSFLVASMTPIEMEIAMGFWNKNFFDEQNGIPDGLISVNKDTLDSDLARIRQEIRDFFGGTRRGVAIARETDMKYQAWGRSQKDAEFIQGADLVAKQIGRTMGFPDGYWSESANRANAEQARATMIAGAVWPLLVALHEDMNAGVIKRWWGENFRAEFKDIRPEDRALKVSEQTLRIQYWTVNELRAEDGKDPLDDPRGEMFVAEVGKGTPIVGTPAAEQTEEFIKEQEDEVAALEAEAGVEEGGEAVEETAEGGLPMEEEAPMKGIVQDMSSDGWDWVSLPKGLSINDIPEQYRAGVIESVRDMAMPTPAQEQAMRDLGLAGAHAGTAFRDALITDLARWERKAIKAVKAGRSACVRFESAAIPPEEQERIRAALGGAETVDEVKAAFKAADDIDGQWDAATEWAKQVIG
jgi:HK97 family phage portal protein